MNLLDGRSVSIELSECGVEAMLNCFERLQSGKHGSSANEMNH
jgi:hypothetical protein